MISDPEHRARTLESPTQLAARIYDAAHDLLLRETDGTFFRLVGVGVSDLGDAAEADHADLLDQRTPKLKATSLRWSRCAPSSATAR